MYIGFHIYCIICIWTVEVVIHGLHLKCEPYDIRMGYHFWEFSWIFFLFFMHLDCKAWTVIAAVEPSMHFNRDIYLFSSIVISPCELKKKGLSFWLWYNRPARGLKVKHFGSVAQLMTWHDMPAPNSCSHPKHTVKLICREATVNNACCYLCQAGLLLSCHSHS